MRALRTAAALLVSVALLVACARSDPERELRETIAAMAAAIERRDPGAFVEAFADDFTRESSAFGKHDAGRVLAGVLLRHDRIAVTAVVTAVRIDGERARAGVRVVAAGGTGLLPEHGRVWQVDSAWRREGGRWRVFNAEWREGP